MKNIQSSARFSSNDHLWKHPFGQFKPRARKAINPYETPIKIGAAVALGLLGTASLYYGANYFNPINENRFKLTDYWGELALGGLIIGAWKNCFPNTNLNKMLENAHTPFESRCHLFSDFRRKNKPFILKSDVQKEKPLQEAVNKMADSVLELVDNPSDNQKEKIKNFKNSIEQLRKETSNQSDRNARLISQKTELALQLLEQLSMDELPEEEPFHNEVFLPITDNNGMIVPYSPDVTQQPLIDEPSNTKINQDKISMLVEQLRNLCVSKDKSVKTSSDQVDFEGIVNGGNTCYLASAVQVIAAIPHLSKHFDPNKNPLKQQDSETEDDFEKRILIQKAVHDIVNKVNSNVKVLADEINGLREICHEYGMIESLYGQESSPLTLGQLLDVVKYNPVQMYMDLKIQPTDLDDYSIIEEDDKIPGSYTLLTDIDKKTRQALDLTLDCQPHFKNFIWQDETSMQTLINEYWEDDLVEEYRVTEKIDGKVRHRQYSQAKKIKEINESQQNYPKILPINITQGDSKKLKITQPEEIYPYGTDKNGQGIGPKYRLAALIEHLPGHYVAYRVNRDGTVKIADDSTVETVNDSSVTGEAYFYVRD